MDPQYMRDEDIPSREVLTPRRAQKLKKQNEEWLMGPVPLTVLRSANSVGRNTLYLWLILKHVSNLRKTSPVKITYSRLARYGISRMVVWRGLRALEQARLIRVSRSKGSALQVTVIVPTQD